MPVYEFWCRCSREELSTVRSMSQDTMTKVCPNCGELAQRRFSVPSAPVFEEHFSIATGQMVTSEQDFKRQLKRASDEATEKTGIPHNFVPTEVKPMEGPGTESQARRQRELGTPGFQRKQNYF